MRRKDIADASKKEKLLNVLQITKISVPLHTLSERAERISEHS